ncbi:YjiH family protein [Candidatus Cetobacterium colombiensis]|uniref:YjiH family protein n=1 Tax=Candidatus Cetobacterium colombiensis TaxID=3073100 RepID=A0ABU4WFW4_9FUSO|nr:YjiH family protein [Candidatus Cetobacterium colombiensis]MDX8337255.1 YjiH family protein [Candidatus Cetobacterium colombiensis]
MEEIKKVKKSDIMKYIFLNFIGIFMFFIPITLHNKNTIPLDHIASFITTSFPEIIKIYILILMGIGAFRPLFVEKNWLKNKTSLFFTIAKLCGFAMGVSTFLSIGPKALFEKDMLPFLFDKLVTPLSVVIPLGGAFIIFLVGFGLLEFMGVLMENVMRPIFKTPGKSSIDAVASFVGSYSIGLLITNKVYTDGKYSLKEAAIIATGFSTVSATFMIVVAKTLDLIEIWNFYFWSCILITFLVTAITVRLFPLNKIPNIYYENQKFQDEIVEDGTIFGRAFLSGINSAQRNDESVCIQFLKNYKEGFIITAGILPSIMSIGLLGLVLAKYTPIFDFIGYIYLPFTKILGFENPHLIAKALSTSIAEMFLPAILVTKEGMLAKYVVAIVSISEILFFSASIPCILSTDIKIKVTDLIIIWIQRVILSLVLATIFGYIFLK